MATPKDTVPAPDTSENAINQVSTGSDEEVLSVNMDGPDQESNDNEGAHDPPTSTLTTATNPTASSSALASENAMSDVSNDSDQDVINVDLDEDEYNFEDYDGINTPPTNTVAAATDPSAAVTNPSALTDSAATPSTASAATPTVFADIHHTPMNLSAAPTQPGAGATVVTAPRGLGASTSIHPITLKDALNGTTTPRATTTEVTKPVGKHEYRGRTSCDRCRDPQKEKCVLKPGNSDCDRCRRLGHVCQWTFAGTPGGRYHQERFGRVPLSGPWLRLCADAATAPVAANGGNAFDEAGSGGDAPLPQPFDYYSGEEVVNEEEADEAADEDEDDDVDMEQEES